MKLVVQELSTGGIDQIVTPEKNTIVEAIRPHLYRHNFPTGSLKLQIIDATSTVIAESETINISIIALADFFHGYVRFFVNAYLEKDQPYTIRLLGIGGYVFDESAYCGWCNGFDLEKYPMDAVPANTFRYPFDLEIWERTVK
jgi:hypothetical protein